MAQPDYQLIIVGGGPAGLTAGMYAARARLRSLLLEKGAVGGQMLNTDWVDNYPGFIDGISGFDLVEKLNAHAERFGMESRIASVSSMDLNGPVKTVTLEDGSSLTARTVIICTGARPLRLDIPGEKEFAAKGVSYCATCDGPFYRNQEIAVIGGGDSAIQEALHLTKFASTVTIIHRRNELRATKIMQEKAFENEKISFLFDSRATRIDGDQTGVTHLQVSGPGDTVSSLTVTGVFIFIGTIPNNETIPLDQIRSDEYGFILTDTEMETNIPGVFAAGDIRSKRSRQIINAAGEGAVAQLSAEHYLSNLAGQ